MYCNSVARRRECQIREPNKSWTEEKAAAEYDYCQAQCATCRAWAYLHVLDTRTSTQIVLVIMVFRTIISLSKWRIPYLKCRHYEEAAYIDRHPWSAKIQPATPENFWPSFRVRKYRMLCLPGGTLVHEAIYPSAFAEVFKGFWLLPWFYSVALGIEPMNWPQKKCPM